MMRVAETPPPRSLVASPRIEAPGGSRRRQPPSLSREAMVAALQRSLATAPGGVADSMRARSAGG
jgi:hypothetical protein